MTSLPHDNTATQQRKRTLSRRRRSSALMMGVVCFLGVLAVLPLLFILGHIVVRGFSAMSTTFLVRLPSPAGIAGGTIQGVGLRAAGAYCAPLRSRRTLCWPSAVRAR